eukprot:gene33645-biopygen26640
MMSVSTWETTHHVYRSYYHDIVQRSGTARVDVSDVQLMRWYHKRVDVRKPTLHFSEFREAFLELAPHYYHYEGDRFEDNPAIITPDISPDPELTAATGPHTGEDLSDHDESQVSTGHPALTDAAPPSRTPRLHYPPSDYTEADIVDLSTRDLKRLEVDDSSPQALIEQIVARIYRMSTLLNIDAAMGDKKFEHSIKAEILDNLITKTGTLEAISQAEVKALPEHTFIHTVVKCKRKQNSDGTYDKHKTRTAVRGEARGRPPPASFSPTINALTFQFVLQVATSKNLHRATQDIKYAYLNAPLPDDTEPIITKLDDNIADICVDP